jgi:hypothetical protein
MVPFSDYEREALARLYAKGTKIDALVRKMGYPKTRVLAELKAMGLQDRRSPARVWTAEEDERLRSITWPINARVLRSMFPGATTDAIRIRGKKLGIQVQTRGWSSKSGYTEVEDDIIRIHFGRAIVREWAHLLPGRSVKSIQARATTLGLRSYLSNRSIRQKPKDSSHEHHAG